jgi:hypothetical protein
MTETRSKRAAEEYQHLVEIDERQRTVTIFRVQSWGNELFTSVKLPEASWDEDPDGAQEFCRMLGENLLLDSPSARRLLMI